MGCGSCGSGGCSPAGCGSTGSCGTGGCNRLNTYDWLSEIMLPHGVQVFPYVEVRFKGARKEFFKVNLNEFDLNTGDWVVVETKSGNDLGRISLKGELVRLQMLKKRVKEDSEEIKNILRLANEDDIQSLKDLRAKEPELLTRSRAIIQTENLEMKLSEIEFQGDGSKIFFYYTADERVDFRNLIRVLATEFKVRVEMRQIGARQEAAVLGGIGICGRELCCSTWLSDFKSVPTSAARYQNLSLNPTKLAGQCGRLKCCLNYELDTYLDALKAFPEKADYLYTESGKAELFKTDVFRQIMWYVYKEGSNHTPYPVDVQTVKEILAMNIDNRRPESLEALAIQEEELAPNEDFLQDLTSDMSLNRFDRSKGKNRSKNKNTGNQRPVTDRFANPGNRNPNQRPQGEGNQNPGNRNPNQRPQSEGNQNPGNPNPNQRPQGEGNQNPGNRNPNQRPQGEGNQNPGNRNPNQRPQGEGNQNPGNRNPNQRPQGERNQNPGNRNPNQRPQGEGNPNQGNRNPNQRPQGEGNPNPGNPTSGEDKKPNFNRNRNNRNRNQRNNQSNSNPKEGGES